MIQNWYLVDENGFHPIQHTGRSMDVWPKANFPSNTAIWPAFTQLAVDASPTAVQNALLELAAENLLLLENITTQPDLWHEAIYIATDRNLTLISEPMTDLDDRILQAPVAEALMQRLAANGAFFGYDPAGETLHLTLYNAGSPAFSWSDSTQPGPSYALTFHTDKTCTHEDPRYFALQKLGIPHTSTLLDRYAFIESELRTLGLDSICPELQEKQISAVLQFKNID